MDRYRRFAPILVLLFCLSLSFPVLATDSNAFFNEHASECRAEGGSYLLNGEPGYVSVLCEPGGTVQDYLFNEQQLTVYGFWQDSAGRDWAQLRYTPMELGYARSELNGERIGWLERDSLLPLYDKSDFVDAHYDQFIHSEVALVVKDWNGILLWPYPGSGGQGQDLGWTLPGESDTLRFPAYWVDSLGRRWGAYSAGDMDGFLCLDDPFARENLLPEIPQPSHVIPPVLPDRLPVAPPLPQPFHTRLDYIIAIAALGLFSAFLVRKMLVSRREKAD